MTTDRPDTVADDDVSRRLTDLLTRSADAVDVHPDLDAIVDAPTSISLIDGGSATGPTSRRGGRLQPARRLALGAVAAAAIVALVAAALAVRDDDPAQPVASGPGTTTASAPTDAPTADVYPVVDEWPEGFEARDAMLQDVGVGSVPGPTAVIGRTDGDAVVEGITVQAFRGASSDLELAETTPVTVGGREGVTLESYGHAGEERGLTLLLRDGEVLLVLSGDDPVGLVEAAPDVVTARIDGDGVELEIGDLPAPYEVVAGPTAARDERTWPSLHAGSDLPGNPPPFVLVEVRPGDPLDSVAHAGTARPIDVGGVPGWIAEGEGIDPDAVGSTYVAWAPVDGITVSVSGAVDRATALAVAREVRLVSRAAWDETYGDALTDLSDPSDPPDEAAATTTEASTDAGSSHELMPSFGYVPEGLEVEVEGPSSVDGEEQDSFSSMLIARPLGGGEAFVDSVVIRAYDGAPSWWPVRHGEPVVVNGREGRLFDEAGPLEWQSSDSKMLVVPGSTTMVIIGADPLGLVEAAPDVLLSTPNPSGPPTIGEVRLPGGYMYLDGPLVIEPEQHPSAFFLDGEAERGFLEVAPEGHGREVANSVLTLGLAEDVDLGEADAWLVERSSDATAVTWVVDGVRVALDIAVDRETALAIAAGVRFPGA